jgi:hypothetical protein
VSKDRRLAFILLRKDTNFQLHISGTTRPFRKSNEEFSVKFEYHPCIYCKGLFRKQYLRRHAKKCISKPNTSGQIRSRMDHVSNSQIFVTSASDPTDTISKLNVKCQVRVILKSARENKLIHYQKLTQQFFFSLLVSKGVIIDSRTDPRSRISLPRLIIIFIINQGR